MDIEELEEKLLFRFLRRMWFEKHYQGRQSALAMRKYFSNEKMRMARNTQPKDWVRFKKELQAWLEEKRAKMN